jgi:RNA polymerase sigma-70 factor (ECF subfamily)
MTPGFDNRPPAGEGRGRFATTRWSVVLAAGKRGRPESRHALAELCEAYWYPLYAEARRRGRSAEDASDLVQGFFARLLEKNDLAAADPTRGRFRSFLLAAFGHFLANEWDRQHARKRGGGRKAVPLDVAEGESRYRREAAHDETPERIYDRRWALSLIDRALARLRDECARAGKAALFETLEPALSGNRAASYAELAESLGMTEGAVKTAVHRLRTRCGAIVREEVAETVSRPEEIDEELGHLFAALES